MRPEFVEFVPHSLEEGAIYISIPYATASHLCACGCGAKVVTPIGQAEWELIFDGERTSLFPSIGNWQFPCKSHYWIWRNAVIWSTQWTSDQIEAGRRRDEHDLKSYFDRRIREAPPRPPSMPSEPVAPTHGIEESAPSRARPGLGARLGRLFRG